jgi:thiamine transport system permease protein
MAPLGVSSVALGFALLLVFLKGPLAAGGRPTAIIIAHSILAYPFFIRAVVPVLESIERNLIEAARSLGATKWRTFLDVELPLVSRGILVGAVFAFAISLGEMSATIMLIRPKLSTIPVTIYNLIGARKFGGASAMSVLLILVTGIAFVLIERFGERVFRR